MAIGIKEIKKRGEALKEQGENADRDLARCQSNVSTASSRLTSAQAAVTRALMTTDSEGSAGEYVGAAMAELRLAKAELELSQRELEEAEREVERIKSEKRKHIEDIDEYNEIGKSNIEKLRQLESKAFSNKSNYLVREMTEGYNEAEDIKAELLESMGEVATPDHISVSENQNAESVFGVELKPLSKSEADSANRGGGSTEGEKQSNTYAAPVGGALGNVAAHSDYYNNRSSGSSGSNMPGNNNVSEKNNIVNSQAITLKPGEEELSGFVITNNGGDKYIVKSDHYDKYKEMLDDLDQYEYMETTDFRDIPAKEVEGIYLNDDEAHDANLFWGRGREYDTDSETFFGKIAAKIPEVRNRIESGEPTEYICSDEEMRTCYDFYFDSPINVYQVDDFYVFSGAGRHRVMAAQKQGQSIPVKVIGKYEKKEDINRSNIIKDFVDQNVGSLNLPHNGVWSKEGESAIGNSDFIISDDASVYWKKDGDNECTGAELKAWMMENYGTQTVHYDHKEPEFRPFMDRTIGEITVDHMSTDRDGKEGTFSYAYKMAMERLNLDSPAAVERYMKENQLTWHECADRRTIIAVPTRINAAFKHSGGISMERSVESVGETIFRQTGGAPIRMSREFNKVEAVNLDRAIESQHDSFANAKKELFGKK